MVLALKLTKSLPFLVNISQSKSLKLDC